MSKHIDPATIAAADTPAAVYSTPFKLIPAKVVAPAMLNSLVPVTAFGLLQKLSVFGRIGSLSSAQSAVEDKAIALSPAPGEPKRQQRDEQLGVPAEMLSAEAVTLLNVHRFDCATVDSLSFADFFDLIKTAPFAQRVRALRAERDKSVHVEKFLDGTPVQANYEQMLQRIAAHTLGTGKEKTLALPGVRIEPQGRKTIWINFRAMCELLNRSLEEVKSFIEYELTTTSTLDGEQRLHITVTRVTPEKMQNLVKKFASSHVLCGSCNGYNTVLVRNSVQRLVEIQCRECGATRVVEQSGGGFQAIANRRDRKRMRALA